MANRKSILDSKRAIRFFLSKNEVKKNKTRNRNKSKLLFGRLKRACDKYIWQQAMDELFPMFTNLQS